MFYLEFSEIPISTILIACCVLLLYIYGRYPATFWSKVGVPSPPATMFVGHMDRLFDSKTGIRYNVNKWTKQYGKIFGVLFFRDPLLFVTDLDVLKEIYVKDFNNYTDRYFIARDALWNPLLTKGLFLNRGAEWRRVRRITNPCFSSRKLKNLTHHINDMCHQLVDALHKHIEDGTHPEAKTVFSAYSMDAIAGPAFGLKLNCQTDIDGTFYRHVRGMVKFGMMQKVAIGVAAMFPFLQFVFKLLDIRFMRACHANYVEKEFTKLVMERKMYPDKFEAGDFIQSLINAEADSLDDISGSKTLTTEEIVSQCVTFIVAGFETTSTTLQWLMYELAKKPDIQTRLVAEIDDVIGNDTEVTYEHCQRMKYLECVINEALRMYPALVYHTRIAQRTTTLKGFTVPAGTAIGIPAGNICRDPENFENPDSFIPERFMDETRPVSSLLTSLPFGFGPRQCIGMRLGWLQLKIAAVHVLREFSINGTLPELVGVDDFAALPLPRENIHLILSKRE